MEILLNEGWTVIATKVGQNWLWDYKNQDNHLKS